MAGRTRLTCSVCGAAKRPRGLLCGTCRFNAGRRRARRCAAAVGLCTDCRRRSARPGRVLCGDCARIHSAADRRRYASQTRGADRAARAKARREAAVAAGLCGRCRRRPCGRFKDCLTCRNRKAEVRRASWNRRRGPQDAAAP